MRGRTGGARGPAPLAARLATLLAALVAALLLAPALPGVAAAQDLACEAGDREVRTLRFTGNRAFGDEELASVVATTPSSYLSRLRVIGTRRCLDRDEFPRDLLRLVAYYRKRGYPEAAVDTTVRVVGPRAVAVTFRIAEGAPMRVDTVAVTGLEGVRAEALRAMPPFPLRPGSVFDRAVLEAARDSIRGSLRDHGYPTADALLQWSTDVARRTANAEVQVVPGPFTRIGAITVRFDTVAGRAPTIPTEVVRRTLGVRVGDPVSARDLVEAQRTLYQTDAYRRVELRVDTGGRAPGAPDTLATLAVGVAQGDLHAARASAGWATLDCFRLQGEYTDRFFLPRAQRLEVTGRVSRIGLGWPLDFARGLCAGQARRDVYADTANYYLGATLRQPTLFRLRRVPSLTLFTSRASEYNAYQRVTPIGALFSLASRPGSRLPSTASFQLEVGRTTANPAVFCAVFNACDEPTRDLLARPRRLGVLGYSIARNRADNPFNPTRGSVQRLTVRHSGALTASERTQRFDKAVAEATWYLPLGDGVSTLTAHVQGGTVLGTAPPQERLFAGGPTTVRGYRQNELGPVVYIVPGYDSVASAGGYLLSVQQGTRPQRVVPAGGDALLVGNLELALRSPVLPSLLSLALFADAGEVWTRRPGIGGERRVRVTPGAGVRVRSLFGAIRVDLGYNPYAPRSGAAYYLGTLGSAREQVLYCVSPGNRLVVTPGTAETPGRQAEGRCDPAFRPSRAQGFFRRLNPSIWIGQAF